MPPSSRIWAAGEKQFCCNGCSVAYSLIVSGALDGYYRLPERRRVAVQPRRDAFAEFDHDTFLESHAQSLPSGLRRVELLLEGVHCGSCVWLVERIPLLLPGVARAELDLRRAVSGIEWDPAEISLSGIARTLDKLGYTPHPFRGTSRDAVRRLEDRAAIVRIAAAGAIAINVMLASLALYSGWLGDMDAEWERYFRWVAFVLVTPAIFWPGRIFFSGAASALRIRVLNMDVPIAVGLGAGYLHGAWNTVKGEGPVYFDGLAVLIFALLAGRYLQTRGQRAANDSADLLHSVMPAVARVIEVSGAEKMIPAAALLPGMIARVAAGEMFPADGVVVEGSSTVDNSLLTGESASVRAEVDSQVWGGTLNLSAALCVRVVQAGELTRAARILKQVEESARRKAPVVLLANRMAGVFVAIVLALAALTFLVWMQVDQTQALDNAIALLIVTCPCALALATPLAVSVAVGRAAQAGILVKGGDVLEALARPGHMLLDKTGTLTEARMGVVGWNGSDWLRSAVLGLEAHSVHPVAHAFRSSWPDVLALPAFDVTQSGGEGIHGVVGGRIVRVGRRSYVDSTHCGHPEDSMAKSGKTVANCVNTGDFGGAMARFGHTEWGNDDASLSRVFVSVDGDIQAVALIGDNLRDDAVASVRELGALGWNISVLSGDEPAVAKVVGQRAGIPGPRIYGGLSPEEKLDYVRSLGTGETVVMVGDGVNDAAAMAASTVGVGVHGGAEACLETADVYLAQPGLKPLVQLVIGAQRTMQVIRRNIVFALIYNVVGAGMAMTGILNPLAAAILMPASSLTVVISSWRSRTFKAPITVPKILAAGRTP